MAGGRRKIREIKLSFMCGIHDGAVRVCDADRIGGWAAIDDMCVDSTKVRSTAAIGNGE